MPSSQKGSTIQKSGSPPGFSQRCVKCSRTHDVGEHRTRCECGGMVAFEYPHDSIELPPSKKASGLARYWPLLPIFEQSHLASLDGSGFPTPLYESRALGGFLGPRHLWIKDESVNPTKTFKDREALITLSRFQEININEFVMYSTGNTAAAFVTAMAKTKPPMKAHVFLPKGTLIDFPVGGNVDLKLVDGDYHAAINQARSYSKMTGLPLEGGFSNPNRTEAAKTIAFEVAEAGVEPDWYVQGVTNGSGVYGFHKGYSELVRFGLAERVPRILCVQPEGCAPMVRAFRHGRERLSPQDVPSESKTFVTTLACTNPEFSYPYLRGVVLDTDGDFEEVSDRESAYAFMLLLKLERKLVDPAAAVALAGIIKKLSMGAIRKDDVVLLNLSGGIRAESALGPTGAAPHT